MSNKPPERWDYDSARQASLEAQKRGHPYRWDTVGSLSLTMLNLDQLAAHSSPSHAGELLEKALAASIRARQCFNGSKAAEQAIAAAERSLCASAGQMLAQPIRNLRDLLLLGDCAREAAAESKPELTRILLKAMAVMSATEPKEAM
jgi:hypothetical protein